MEENEQNHLLSVLKANFPGYEDIIESLYSQDPVFRQIASEYHECITNRDMDMGTTGKVHDIYADTIHELSEELLGHLLKDPTQLSGS